MRFDKPLQPGALDNGNWSGRWNNQFWASALSVAIAPNKVLLDIVLGMPAPPGGVVSYAPPPFDVRSTPGLVPAAAFAGFPIT